MYIKFDSLYYSIILPGPLMFSMVWCQEAASSIISRCTVMWAWKKVPEAPHLGGRPPAELPKSPLTAEGSCLRLYHKAPWEQWGKPRRLRHIQRRPGHSWSAPHPVMWATCSPIYPTSISATEKANVNISTYSRLPIFQETFFYLLFFKWLCLSLTFQ